jgi:hypothetical protein
MFTLINCPSAACAAARDKISVQIKEGFNGDYREVYLVEGRVRDDRWIQEKFKFIAADNLVYVR